ncbi:endonuclease [Aliifodinibius salipaludis]|uniref:Endonuclease n=1 Tax=Fodinibius salipaludis TaxID=2032627 RepID=A0A2A2G8S2_9BACT|nr:GIY-YIG nuclease family protein [Aliifodinibius salipaludis]PAU93698.1 endonuclease [Aliifodinibius salipaludis]
MYHIYILSSLSRVLYVGVTGNLYKRIQEHKKANNPKSFTAKYNVNRLVYFEDFKGIQKAIKREKQLKRWRREKKVTLIESINPGWKDLSKELYFDRSN